MRLSTLWNVTSHPEKADRSDATIIRVRSPDLLVSFFRARSNADICRVLLFSCFTKVQLAALDEFHGEELRTPSWSVKNQLSVVTFVESGWHVRNALRCRRLCRFRVIADSRELR